MNNILQKHRNELDGIISCNDRIVLRATLKGRNYAQAMTSFLYEQNILVFDYPKQMQALRDLQRENAAKLANDTNTEIMFVRCKNLRKESLVQNILKYRGEAPGLVCILSAMESCPVFKPWHDKASQKTFLKYSKGQCLHYYYYFIDEQWGLCYMRVPTWAPFGLQFYCNGHNLLAHKLKKEYIHYKMIDNCFDYIADYQRAQELADTINVHDMCTKLQSYAAKFSPASEFFLSDYHWTVMQLEYATDFVFKDEESLQSIYDDIQRNAVLSVKLKDIATFFTKRPRQSTKHEIGSRFQTLIMGTRLKHAYGRQSIKMYDKFKKILRIEMTSNDLAEISIFRTVHHRNGESEKKYAKGTKDIFYLNAFNQSMCKSNQRYIEFISAMDEYKLGREKLQRVTKRVVNNNRSYRGLNFFDNEDKAVLKAISQGEFNIEGFRNKDIKAIMDNKSTSQISRLLKNLRLHGVIKKKPKSYAYHLTQAGKETIITSFKIIDFLIPKELSA